MTSELLKANETIEKCKGFYGVGYHLIEDGAIRLWLGTTKQEVTTALLIRAGKLEIALMR